MCNYYVLTYAICNNDNVWNTRIYNAHKRYVNTNTCECDFSLGDNMSLPSKVVFYNKGKKIFEQFVNIGWVIDIDTLIIELNYPDVEWDEVYLCGNMYTVEEIVKRASRILKERPNWVNAMLNYKEFPVKIKEDFLKDDDVLI